MNAKFVRSLLIAAAFLLMAASVFAHHGTSVSYDVEHPIVLKGTVTEFHYTNPHLQLYFDVKDANGKVTHWAGEGTDPATMLQNGWNKKRTMAALAPGAEITVKLSPARNGKPIGVLDDIKLANGDTVCGPRDARGETCKENSEKKGK